METKNKNCMKAEILGACSKTPPLRPQLLSPLVLAYVGDAIYDLYVRTYLVSSSDACVHALHLRSAGIVCAAAQASAYRRIEPMLNDDEISIYKRGRNSHMGTVPKNASIADYRTATGFETLVGYLYLCGEDARVTELMSIVLGKEEE